MSLFVITCLDRPASLDLRLATRARHLQYLADAPNVRAAGPFLDPAGHMIGSMLVVEADSQEQAELFAARDPYAVAGLFASSTVRGWKQTAGTAVIA